MKKKYINFLIILIISVVIEVIVFNITSYYTLFGKYEVKEYYVKDASEIFENDGKSYLTFKDIGTKVRTIKIQFKNYYSFCRYQYYYTDEACSNFVSLPGKTYLGDNEKTAYMQVHLSGNCTGIKLEVPSDVYEEDGIEKIVINEKIPFRFEIRRFICLFAILCAIYYLKTDKIFDEEYSKKSFDQELILLIVLGVFLIILTFLNLHAHEQIIADTYNHDYVQAILSGKTNLDFEVSDAFKKIENPYDATARGSVTRNVDYLWDTAYYNGKTFVYFGILPLLLVFLPYYVLTKKVLAIYVVVYLASIICALLLKELLTTIISRYFKHIPFRNVVMYLIMMLFGSLLLYANGISRVYELVIVFGLLFMLLGFYFMLKSLDSEKKYIYLFFGSLCLALAVACRPTDLFASIIIIPYLLSLLIKNIKEDKKSLVKLIAAVGIPYISVGCALMWFNYIRFDSPFEFGAAYQLTVYDIKDLGFRLSAMPMGMITNLFGIPVVNLTFPFIDHHNNYPTYYGYYYLENMIGGVFCLAPICFMNFKLYKMRKSENKELKWITIMLVVVAILICGISAVMAGSNQRYLIDYSWMLITSGIILACYCYEELKSDEAKKIANKAIIIVAMITMFLGIGSGIISEKRFFEVASPEVYYQIQSEVCFWE